MEEVIGAEITSMQTDLEDMVRKSMMPSNEGGSRGSVAEENAERNKVVFLADVDPFEGVGASTDELTHDDGNDDVRRSVLASREPPPASASSPAASTFSSMRIE
jgi:hypothetical protein